MAFLSIMETSWVLLVLVGIIGVVILKTTPIFVHFQVFIDLTRTLTLNIAHIVHIHFKSVLVTFLTRLSCLFWRCCLNCSKVRSFDIYRNFFLNLFQLGWSFAMIASIWNDSGILIDKSWSLLTKIYNSCTWSKTEILLSNL